MVDYAHKAYLGSELNKGRQALDAWIADRCGNGKGCVLLPRAEFVASFGNQTWAVDAVVETGGEGKVSHDSAEKWRSTWEGSNSMARARVRATGDEEGAARERGGAAGGEGGVAKNAVLTESFEVGGAGLAQERGNAVGRDTSG